ncbi:MAG: hypothetical protein Q7V58_11770 [Actinomycetota bacterium]|nr:hypothetical protein [Actinomycetota bacterium]
MDYAVDGPSEAVPYAQAAYDGAGWYCEVVSGIYLPGDQWSLDEVALRRAGWRMPDRETANWWQLPSTAQEVGDLLVWALRDGRGCDDPARFAWTVGSFPPGPDGGKPVLIAQQDHMLLAA